MKKLETREEHGFLFSNVCYINFFGKDCPYERIGVVTLPILIANKYLVEYEGKLYYQMDFTTFEVSTTL